MNHDDAHNQKPDEGFKSLSGILDNLQGSLFSGFEVTPDEEETPQDTPKKARTPNAKLAKVKAEIVARPDKAERAYLARQVVQCSLPRSTPGNKTVFVRRNGNFSLVLEALTDPETMQTVGLPSGSIAKILWLWINTEAVFNKNSDDVENKYRISPGRTLNNFLLELGLDPSTGGGKFSHARAVKEELTKLLRCHISFHHSEGDKTKGRKSFVNMPIARSATLWWDFKNPEQGELFESEIMLDEAFFEAITASPVPVDMRVVVALVRSPLAIDLYTWATYRIFTLKQARQSELRISLAALKEQFGSEYKRADNFKAAIDRALKKIKEVWPTLDYTLNSKALILRVGDAKPTISARGEKRSNPALNQPNQISPAMRERFYERYPLHNLGEVFGAFDEWRTDKGIISRDTDGHFWDFVTNHYFKR